MAHSDRSVQAASLVESQSAPIAARPRHNPAALIFWLGALGLISLYFIAMRLHFLTDFTLASYSPYFWAKRYGVLIHIWAGVIALGCGFAQVWLGATGRIGALHRRMGWIYAATVMISSLAAMHLAVMAPGHLTYASGLFLNAVAWAGATAMGLWAQRRKRTDLHREWMMRSFILALAFTAARVMVPMLRMVVEVPKDPIADEIMATAAWACWVLPLLAFEVQRSWRVLAR